MQSLGSPKWPLLVGQTKGFSFEIKSPFAPFCSKPANAFNLKREIIDISFEYGVNERVMQKKPLGLLSAAF